VFSIFNVYVDDYMSQMYESFFIKNSQKMSYFSKKIINFVN